MSAIAVQLARMRGTQMGDPVGDAPEKGVTVRPPSTALLAVDSLDRAQAGSAGTSDNFIINKNQSLFNGFFNRIALNELVLDWCIPNISAYVGNNTLTVTTTSGPTTKTITLPDGHYTVAEALDTIVTLLNAPTPGGFGAGTFQLEDKFGTAWVTGTSYGVVFLATVGGGTFTVGASELQQELNIATGVPAADAFAVDCPKILPYYYLDFVSPQLTYNQDLKDNSTSSVVRDVLYRWVFSYDNVPPPYDKYGYQILQGYQPFIARRYLNFPKQILWNPAQPVGQLSFQVYTQTGDLLNPVGIGGEMEYQMSLLFSEN